MTRMTALVAALVLFAGSLSTYSFVFANNYQEQINELSAANSEKKDRVSTLAEQADTLEGVVQALQTEIQALQAKINDNNAKRDGLQVEITKAEEELDRQRDVLGQNIKAMYLEGDISTIEMLASSNDLSDFVDKQQYRNSVKDKIKVTLDKITALKLELNSQKEKVEQIIKEQELLKRQVAAQQAEQNRLLNMNQAEQANLNGQIKENNKLIAELRHKQYLETVRLFGGGGGQVGGGGYPWGTAPCLHGGQVKGYCYDYEWGYNGSWRNWQNGNRGYAYRNCTDYVAWKTGASGGLGNAKSWYDRAPTYGYDRGRTPRAGAAAVSVAGTYGHVMYVEAVNGDGSILISDYNRAGPGEFGAKTLTAGQASSLYYVYF